MPIELTLLVWSTALFALYVGVQSTLYRMQHGIKFALTGRDNEPPPNPINARAEKALRNLLETYPVFVALSVVAGVAAPGDGLFFWGQVAYLTSRVAYLPLYVLGVETVRSVVWMVSAIGLGMMFVALVL